MTRPALAHAILHARRDRQRCPVVGAPPDAAAAYAVQAAVAAGTGAVGGFKTARKPGAESIMAPIFACDIHPGGSQLDSAFGGQLGVELEIGFRVKALPDMDGNAVTARLADCLEPLVVIEIVDTRLRGRDSTAPLVQLADNQVNGGLVIGPTLHGWDGRSFGTVQARMMAGDTCLLDGPAQVPGGDALASVTGLLQMVGDHCGGVQVGHVIITGSLHPLTYVDPGTQVSGRIDGIGEIAVTIG